MAEEYQGSTHDRDDKPPLPPSPPHTEITPPPIEVTAPPHDVTEVAPPIEPRPVLITEPVAEKEKNPEAPDPALREQILALCREGGIRKRSVVLTERSSYAEDDIAGVILEVPTSPDEDDRYVLLLDSGQMASMTTRGNDPQSEEFRIAVKNGEPWVLYANSGNPTTKKSLLDRLAAPDVGFKGALATHVGNFETDTLPLRADLNAALGKVKEVVGPRNEIKREAARERNIQVATTAIKSALY